MIAETRTNSVCFIGQPLSSGDIVSGFAPETLRSLSQISRKVRFEKGKFIFQNGKIPSYVYIFSHGTARLCSNFNDKTQNIRLIEKNEIIGIREVLGNFPLETNVETLTPCLFDCIEREVLIDFLLNDPKICFRLLHLIGENLQKNYHLFSQLSH